MTVSSILLDDQGIGKIGGWKKTVSFCMSPADPLRYPKKATTIKNAPEAFCRVGSSFLRYCAVESASEMKMKMNWSHKVHVDLMVRMQKMPNGINQVAKKRPKNLKMSSGADSNRAKVPNEVRKMAPRLRKNPAKVPNAVAPKVLPAMSSKMAVILIMIPVYIKNGPTRAVVCVTPCVPRLTRPSRKDEKAKAKRPRGAGLANLLSEKCLW